MSTYKNAIGLSPVDSGGYPTGLIGYTGFVGSNLVKQATFSAGFNSKNFREMRGMHFSRLVCSGVSAVKWQANRDPEKDMAAIRDLADVLETVTADEFVLISTVDVFSDSVGKEEADIPSGENHAYGKHRLWFEGFCAKTFPICRILRLPGLFGSGLRKNILFDMLNGQMIPDVNPRSKFQWYDISRLGRDIEICCRNDLKLMHLAVEPIQTSDIIRNIFPNINAGEPGPNPASYGMRTSFSSLFGGYGGYIQGRDGVLTAIAKWARESRLFASVAAFGLALAA